MPLKSVNSTNKQILLFCFQAFDFFKVTESFILHEPHLGSKLIKVGRESVMYALTEVSGVTNLDVMVL